MRTTVTLDSDIAAKLHAIARERSITFRKALNSVLRAGLAAERNTATPYRLPSRKLGLRAGIDLDKALRLAASLEDDETLRKLELRK